MAEQHIRLGVGQVELPDWRWLLQAFRARFDTGSFATGAAFVTAAGALSEAIDHPPAVDLRAGHVRFVLRSDDAGGVTSRE